MTGGVAALAGLRDGVRFELVDGVGVLTLSRPEALNALNRALVGRVDEVLAVGSDDDELRALVLTGAGRAFCAGADLKELQSRDRAAAAAFDPGAKTLMDNLYEFPKPTVAAVNGLAVGGGCSLALCCDVRIGGPKAALELNFTRIGLVPEGGSTFILPRLVGWSVAADLLLSARRVGVDEAVELGLVNRRVSSTVQLVPAARAWAAELGAGHPASIKAVKELLALSATRDKAAQHRDERERFHRAVADRGSRLTEGLRRS